MSIIIHIHHCPDTEVTERLTRIEQLLKDHHAEQVEKINALSGSASQKTEEIKAALEAVEGQKS